MLFSLEEDHVIAHLFVARIDPFDPLDPNGEAEVRILYDTFMVSFYDGDVEVNSYDQFDYRTALQCHRNSETWEEQPCSW